MRKAQSASLERELQAALKSNILKAVFTATDAGGGRALTLRIEFNSPPRQLFVSLRLSLGGEN
jgi:hypothetical protein